MTTITQTISTLPTAPDPATMTPAEFSTAAAAYVLAQKAMVPQLNTWAGQTNTVAGEVNVAAAAAVENAIDTAADRVQTGLDAIDTAADRVQTGLDATTATNAATALTGTSATTLTPSLAEKIVATQADKSFDAGSYIMLISASNAAVWMFGPVTSYTGTTLTFTPTAIGTATSKSDWTIAGRVGARGATGATGTGITEQTTGFTATGGTTPKTLTVDVDLTGSAVALKTGDDSQLTRQMLKDCGHTVADLGNISNATVTFDYTAGSVQTYTATGSTVTWAFSNWPPTGNLGELLIIGTNMGAYTHSISGLTWTLMDGTTTTSVATFLAQNGTRTAFRSSGVDKILLVTRDSGTTTYASLVSL